MTQKNNNHLIYIFTDGACRGNPGPGGWGVLLRENNQEKTWYGSEKLTTNNRMELMAAIQGLQSVTEPSTIEVTTDSKYVLQGITEWLPRWKKNGWKTAAKTPVKNADLWKMLSQATQSHRIEWRWIKGHSGHRENTLVDALANRAIDEMGAN